MTLKRILVVLTAASVVVLTGLSSCLSYINLEKFQLFRDEHSKARPFNTADEKNETWDVIISTYMRSGSTFLGTNIGHSENSIFFYEPLWQNNSMNSKYHREDGKLCDALKPTCGNNTAFAKKALDRALQYLIDIYNCRLVSHASRIHAHMKTSWFGGPGWDSYLTCRRSKKTHRECLLRLEPVCRNAEHRVAKVLRLDFSYIETLLAAHPRLKAILLLRDPRGILNSHIYTDWFPIDRNNTLAITNDAEVLCSRMDRDIKSVKWLLAHYPNRVRIVQYEDFDDPVRKLKHLFSFLNMDADRFQLKAVHNPGVLPTNKSSDLFSYRKKMAWETVQLIDSHCENVYRELGLVQYKNESHFRNVSQFHILYKLPYSLETP